MKRGPSCPCAWCHSAKNAAIFHRMSSALRTPPQRVRGYPRAAGQVETMSSKKPTVDAKLEKLPHESFYYFLHDESSQRASDRQQLGLPVLPHRPRVGILAGGGRARIYAAPLTHVSRTAGSLPSSVPWAASLPAADAFLLRIHSKATPIRAPNIGPTT